MKSKFSINALPVLVLKHFYTCYTKLNVKVRKYSAVGINSASIPVGEERMWVYA